MKFARVVGNLVATQKYQGLEGVKFLIVQPLNIQRQPEGDAYVAVDATRQAGTDELVFVVASKEAAMALPVSFVPVDAAVVGIVDDVDDRPLYDEKSVAWKVFVTGEYKAPSANGKAPKTAKKRKPKSKGKL